MSFGGKLVDYSSSEESALEFGSWESNHEMCSDTDYSLGLSPSPEAHSRPVSPQLPASPVSSVTTSALPTVSPDPASPTASSDSFVMQVPNVNEFENMTFLELGQRFYGDARVQETITWCRENGILATRVSCSICKSSCREQNYSRAVDKKIWRCSNKKCKKTISIRKGSFFEGSKLQLWQGLGLTYWWSVECGSARGLSQSQLEKELKISNKSVVD